MIGVVHFGTLLFALVVTFDLVYCLMVVLGAVVECGLIVLECFAVLV